MIKLSLSMRGTGYHSSAWLDPRVQPMGAMSIDFMKGLAQTAERGLFDFVFLADQSGMINEANGRNNEGIAEFEPIVLLAALSQATKHVGLIATASTSLHQPYQIARQYASLDHLSHGRAGWNVVTSSRNAEARNYGMEELPPKEDRYERAEEALKVVLQLWRSWDKDAFTCDRQSGLFYDVNKLHRTNHKGKYFRVDGPLNVARTPQGRPLIVQAGGSPRGIELAARYADVVYTAQSELEAGRRFYDQVKEMAAKFGRDPNSILIMPGLLPVVDQTKEKASAKFEALKDLLDPETGREHLRQYFGDLSGVDLDGPVPDIDRSMPEVSRATKVRDMALANGWSLRGLMREIAISRSHNVVVGSASDVADVMEQWYRGGAADGFNINPALSPIFVEDFVDLVVPELQKRGLFKTAYKEGVLRDKLDLGPVD